MNTGVWLYKPEWRIYLEALRVLRDGSWSKEEGFNHAGPPLDLAYAPEMVERLAVGRQEHEASRPEQAFGKVRDKMAMTEYAKGPTWFFVGGNIDQGLFWYVLYVKLGVGTWASERQARWRVHHFWGPGKPWGDRNAKVYARANYMQRVRQFGRFERMNDTTCKRHLDTLWQDLVKGGKERANDSPGWSPYMSPVLPATSVVRFQLPTTVFVPKGRNCTLCYTSSMTASHSGGGGDGGGGGGGRAGGAGGGGATSTSGKGDGGVLSRLSGGVLSRLSPHRGHGTRSRRRK